MQGTQDSILDIVQLVKPSGESVWCTRISCEGQNWVALLQIHRLFLPDRPLQTFKHGLSKAGVQSRLASVRERRFCALHSAVGSRAASCSLVEVKSLCHMLQDFIFEPEVIQTIASIEGQSAQTQPSPASQNVSKPAPLCLPKLKLTKADYRMHYSLHQAEQNKQPVKGQVERLVAWLTEDVQLDRNGPPVAYRTKENMLAHIWLYLGFLQLHLKIDDLSLWYFLDLDRYAEYLSFHKNKGNGYSTIVVHITTAKSVLQHLAYTNPAANRQVQEG